jgi:RNA polymerase sigma-70 factor (ECF subfamily)
LELTVNDQPTPANGIDPATQDRATADDVLVEAAKRDAASFGILYERYAQQIYLYCFRRIGSPEAADDATSTIFLKAFTALPRFRTGQGASGSTFRSWLFAIAHNVVADTWRRNRQHLSLDAVTGRDDGHDIADAAHGPEHLALGAEEARMVVALLAHLPERQRAAVELRLAGLSIAEAAKVLGMSPSAVKSLQFRGYQTLREVFMRSSSTLSREAHR